MADLRDFGERGRVETSVGPDHPYSSLVRIDVSALSHSGHVRLNNEDHFFVTRLGRRSRR